MGRTYGSFLSASLFQLIKISCYYMSRGHAPGLLKKTILLKHNPVSKSKSLKGLLKKIINV
jgi:hypothetical protein